MSYIPNGGLTVALYLYTTTDWVSSFFNRFSASAEMSRLFYWLLRNFSAVAPGPQMIRDRP
jgi:hypothetical protein